MKAISTTRDLEVIYEGLYDLEPGNVKINIVVNGENLFFDLEQIINDHNRIAEQITANDLDMLLNVLNLESELCADGNRHICKTDKTEAINTCYLGVTTNGKNQYLICIAFDEIQPTVYQAQLLQICSFP